MNFWKDHFDHVLLALLAYGAQLTSLMTQASGCLLKLLRLWQRS